MQRLMELSQYFSGNMPLVNVEQDEELQKYFMVRANDVQAFDFGNSTKAGNAAGRKIQKTIEALKDVERFEQVHENLYIMPFLKETCDLLQQMIRIVNLDGSRSWSALGSSATCPTPGRSSTTTSAIP